MMEINTWLIIRCKMKKVILCVSVLTVSSSVLAGGNGHDSWQPSVSPINCIQGYPNGWKLSNSKECQEVFERGYAKGINYEGELIPEGGATETKNRFYYRFYYNISTSAPYPEIPGQKTRLGKVSATWIK